MVPSEEGNTLDGGVSSNIRNSEKRNSRDEAPTSDRGDDSEGRRGVGPLAEEEKQKEKKRRRGGSMKKGSRQVLSKCCPSSSLEKKKIEKKKKKKKDRPFGSLPPRISFHHGALEKRGSVSPLGRRPDLCYDVGTGTPERKQRGRKKQLQRLHRRPRSRWKVPKDTFVFARCAENASVPFDVSRD